MGAYPVVFRIVPLTPGYLRTPPATLRAAPSRRLSRSPGPNPVRVYDYTPLPTERGVVYGRPRRAEDHWVPYAEHYWRKTPPPRVSPRHFDRLRMQGRPSSPGPHHPLLYSLNILLIYFSLATRVGQGDF